ncbi:extracellular matrix protein 2 [Aplochiton taeniatus]
MRWWRVIASLWLLLLFLSQTEAQTRTHGQRQAQDRAAIRGKSRRSGQGRPRGDNPRHHQSKGQRKSGRDRGDTEYKEAGQLLSSYNVQSGKSGQCEYQGIFMFDKSVWSPKPCLTCLCTNGKAVCDELKCPTMHCHFPFIRPGECCAVCMDAVPDDTNLSGHSPVPNDLSDRDPVTPLSQEEMDLILRREEEAHRAEEERLLKKDAEKKRRKKIKKEEERQRKLAERKKKREKEEALELQRQREAEEEEDAEEEELVWLRGDVFQMGPNEPTEEEEEEDEERELTVNRAGLPPGCDISDVIVTCENARLSSFPALSILELKSLSLEGNSISTIPEGAFNGIPNLEWINLGKNKLTSAGIAPKVFRSLKYLSRLYLDGNLLEEIPADLPSTLQEVKINENHLTGLQDNSFLGLSSLVILELEGNMLAEGNVDPQAFSPLTQLSYLRLGRNHFRTVPQGLPPSLLELYLENNLIEEISDSVFNQTTDLNVICLRHNRLEESRIAPLAWINHRNLESIDLSYNQLYLVPSYLPRSLVHLVLVGNQIERVPGWVFAHMEPGLEYLYLSYNRLDEQGVEPESFLGTHGSMVELCLDHNQLVAVPTGINEMTSLHFLRLNDNNIWEVVEDSICDPLDEGDSHLVTLRLENNYIDPRKVSPTAFSCVRSYSSVVLKPQKTK